MDSGVKIECTVSKLEMGGYKQKEVWATLFSPLLAGELSFMVPSDEAALWRLGATVTLTIEGDYSETVVQRSLK
jgi:hypothetical protein